MIETRAGHILIDNVNVSSLDHDDVRTRINTVPQVPFLVPGTVQFNLDPFGTASEREVIQALKKVQLWDLVYEQGGLSKEMDTEMWSIGQKQLLCLARAIIRKSCILILDEAASR